MVPVGGAIVPSVALKATAISGSVPTGTAAAELCVMSAVMFELAPWAMVLGTALTPSTIHGLESAVPVTASQPALPGPLLQPHQLFSAVTVPSTLLSPVTLFPTMRLKLRFASPWLCTNTPVPLPLIVLLVNFTGWLPVKLEPAIHWNPMLAPVTVLF